MKIFDRPGFPNPSRIRIVLAEKGLDSQVEFVSVDLIAAEHKQADFLAKNPSGVLPVLQLDDGTYLSEATAITEYLDNLDGNPTLTGKTPKEKGMIHMMQRRAEAELSDAAGLAIPKDATSLIAWRARVAELPSVKNRSGQNFVADDLRRLGF